MSRLGACLALLSPQIVYAVVSNDLRFGEPVELLKSGADCYVVNRDNPGCGRVINQVVASLRLEVLLPKLIGFLNTDLAWQPGTFEKLLDWMLNHPDVSAAVPQLINPT